MKLFGKKQNVATVEKVIAEKKASLINMDYVMMGINDAEHGDTIRNVLVNTTKAVSAVLALMAVKEKLERKDYLALSFADIEREETIDAELNEAQNYAYRCLIALNSNVKKVEGVPENGIIPMLSRTDKEKITTICYDLVDAIYDMSQSDEEL